MKYLKCKELRKAFILTFCVLLFLLDVQSIQIQEHSTLQEHKDGWANGEQASGAI